MTDQEFLQEYKTLCLKHRIFVAKYDKLAPERTDMWRMILTEHLVDLGMPLEEAAKDK